MKQYRNFYIDISRDESNNSAAWHVLISDDPEFMSIRYEMRTSGSLDWTRELAQKWIDENFTTFNELFELEKQQRNVKKQKVQGLHDWLTV